jgi:hypothetical protein
VEQQDKDIDDDNNRRGNLTGNDVHKPLASIDEEDQRRSGQTTPDIHPKVVIVVPPSHKSEKLKIGQCVRFLFASTLQATKTTHIMKLKKAIFILGMGVVLSLSVNFPSMFEILSVGTRVVIEKPT